MRHKPGHNLLLSGVLLAGISVAVSGAAVAAWEPGSRSDSRAERADRSDVQDRMARDAARDAARDQERQAQDQEAVRLRAERDAQRQEANRVRDLERAEADIAEQLARSAEEAAEQATRAARDAARAAEEAAEEAAEAAEEAAEEAADAAERAARDAARGDAAQLRDLAAAENPELDQQGYPVRRGEVLGLDVSRSATARAQARGFRVIERISLGAGAGDMVRLAVPADMPAQAALAWLRAEEPRGTFDLSHYYGSGYASAGRAVTAPGRAPTQARREGAAFTVGMVDTGVELPAGAGPTRVIQRSFGGQQLARAHGTAVASILARHGAARILSANVFRGDGPVGHADVNGIARALGWLIAERVPVINLSFAGPRNRVVDALIARATSSGQIIVAASGNDGPAAPPAYPAATDGVVAVTATDARNAVYRYAGRGSHIHFAARGVDVPGVLPDGQTALFSGTSFASPFVASVLAHCAHRLGRSSPSACVRALERQARDLGAPGRDDVYGYGLVG